MDKLDEKFFCVCLFACTANFLMLLTTLCNNEFAGCMLSLAFFLYNFVMLTHNGDKYRYDNVILQLRASLRCTQWRI